MYPQGTVLIISQLLHLQEWHSSALNVRLLPVYKHYYSHMILKVIPLSYYIDFVLDQNRTVGRNYLYRTFSMNAYNSINIIF